MHFGTVESNGEGDVASQIFRTIDKQFSDSISAALRSRVPSRGLNLPLYHFTDHEGLHGILQTRSLWASLATALEDTSEIKYALERAKRILAQPKKGRTPDLYDEIASLLDHRSSQIVETLGTKIYVVSFRTNADEAAHWQTYGRAGTGFAIAFNFKHLVIPGVLPMPVLYDPAAQDYFLDQFIESNMRIFYNHLHTLPSERLWALRKRVVQLTAFGIWTLAPILKDPLYNNENEWRLIVFDPENIQVQYGKGISTEVLVRRSNNRDIPYKVLQYETLPIVSLGLGPYAALGENDTDLKQILKKATGFDVPITRSRVLVPAC